MCDPRNAFKELFDLAGIQRGTDDLDFVDFAGEAQPGALGSSEGDVVGDMGALVGRKETGLGGNEITVVPHRDGVQVVTKDKVVPALM